MDFGVDNGAILFTWALFKWHGVKERKAIPDLLRDLGANCDPDARWDRGLHWPISSSIVPRAYILWVLENLVVGVVQRSGCRYTFLFISIHLLKILRGRSSS